MALSGTTANVGIRVYGDKGNSGSRHLSHPGAFRRNSRDVFLITTDCNLGDVTKVVVWHDNSGLYPAWFLSRVVVRNLQTEVRTQFLVNSWLSLSQPDYSIQKEVTAAGREGLTESVCEYGGGHTEGGHCRR